MKNEIHVQKPVPEQKKKDISRKKKVHDRVIIPIIAEGKKKNLMSIYIII